MTRRFLEALLLIVIGAAPLAAQSVGSPLPPWQKGTLDIHVINTGRGDAALLILPDGTTMQFDAGDGGAPVGSPRGVPVVPDATRRPGEWIARYASRVMSHYRTPGIDYAVLSHLHDDHFGAFPELARHVPIRTMLDRAWPEYDDASGGGAFPATDAYVAFARAEPSRMARFEPGRTDQIRLLREPDAYPDFVVRNLFANGQVWTGAGQATRSRFPDNAAALAADDRPNENESSLGIRVSYGAFDFYTGGDIPGRPRPGAADWHDIETPVAQAVGAVEVAAANHHGNRDSTNAFFVSTLQPRLWILQVWSSDHPGHDVLDRMLSKRLYPGDRDVLATNISPANRIVIGPLLDRLISARGHIVIRVDQGGATYRAIVLEDMDESMNVKAVFGPYQSR
jgi:beta-lactamase superfamily II metal-dependent hydrolase